MYMIVHVMSAKRFRSEVVNDKSFLSIPSIGRLFKHRFSVRHNHPLSVCAHAMIILLCFMLVCAAALGSMLDDLYPILHLRYCLFFKVFAYCTIIIIEPIQNFVIRPHHQGFCTSANQCLIFLFYK